jgi:hypothetical protein
MFILKKDIYNRERIRINKIMSIDFSDPMVCFTLSGTSLSNGSQNPIGKLYQKIKDLSLVQNPAQSNFGILFSADKLQALLLVERVELLIGGECVGDSLPISELELKYAY